MRRDQSLPGASASVTVSNTELSGDEPKWHAVSRSGLGVLWTVLCGVLAGDLCAEGQQDYSVRIVWMMCMCIRCLLAPEGKCFS
jgi:hypothetical protein